MNVNEQLRFYTNEATRISFALVTSIDDLNLKVRPIPEISTNCDRLARELSFVADSIKHLSYELKVAEQMV